jgi:hypothetical protein
VDFNNGITFLMAILYKYDKKSTIVKTLKIDSLF